MENITTHNVRRNALFLINFLATESRETMNNPLTANHIWSTKQLEWNWKLQKAAQACQEKLFLRMISPRVFDQLKSMSHSNQSSWVSTVVDSFSTNAAVLDHFEVTGNVKKALSFHSLFYYSFSLPSRSASHKGCSSLRQWMKAQSNLITRKRFNLIFKVIKHLWSSIMRNIFNSINLLSVLYSRSALLAFSKLHE